MFKKLRFSVLFLFVASLFTIVDCLLRDELTRAPISNVKNTNRGNLVLQRLKRQSFRIGFPPVRAQARAPTVIVVPETGARTLPAYSNVPISPYSASSPTVVVSQVPEYNYNGYGRTYGAVPVNPVLTG